MNDDKTSHFSVIGVGAAACLVAAPERRKTTDPTASPQGAATAMKTISIYDATAPITCTATSSEVPVRIEQIERMRANLDRIERTDHGMLLHFPNRSDIEADLHKFTIDEKGCCQFWCFDITTKPDELTLRWDAPPTLDHYITRLVTFFERDEPLTADSGLL